MRINELMTFCDRHIVEIGHFVLMGGGNPHDEVRGTGPTYTNVQMG